MKTTLRYANWLLVFCVVLPVLHILHHKNSGREQTVCTVPTNNFKGERLTTTLVFEKHCFHGKATRYTSVSTAMSIPSKTHRTYYSHHTYYVLSYSICTPHYAYSICKFLPQRSCCRREFTSINPQLSYSNCRSQLVDGSMDRWMDGSIDR